MKNFADFLLFCCSCDEIFGVVCCYIFIAKLHSLLNWIWGQKYNQISTRLIQNFYVLFFLSLQIQFIFFHSSRILLVVEISCTTKFCIVQWRLQRIKERVNASQEIFHSFLLFYCLITNLFCEHSCCYNFWMQQKCNWDYQV